MKAKIITLDIENTPNLAYVWGKWQQDVIKFERESYLLSVAWKWYGEKKGHFLGLPDFESWEKDKTCDKSLVLAIRGLLDEADIVIGHNVERFDLPKISSRFLFHGILPPSPFRVIDTLKIARRHFKLNCNKLDSICKFLKIDGKIRHQGADLWFDCMNGCPKAWKTMKSYNLRDTVITEKVYEKLRPFSEDRVHVGLFEENPMGTCPCCGSRNLVRRGYKVANTRVYRQYCCSDCGRWSRSVLCEKDIKPDVT